MLGLERGPEISHKDLLRNKQVSWLFIRELCPHKPVREKQQQKDQVNSLFCIEGG